MIKLVLIALIFHSMPTSAEVIKLRCQGAYPNWSVDVGPSYIRYQTPLESSGVSLTVLEQKSLPDGKLIVRSAYSTLVAVPNDKCTIEGSRQNFSYALSFGENIGNSVIPGPGCCIKL